MKIEEYCYKIESEVVLLDNICQQYNCPYKNSLYCLEVNI